MDYTRLIVCHETSTLPTSNILGEDIWTLRDRSFLPQVYLTYAVADLSSGPISLHPPLPKLDVASVNSVNPLELAHILPIKHLYLPVVTQVHWGSIFERSTI